MLTERRFQVNSLKANIFERPRAFALLHTNCYTKGETLHFLNRHFLQEINFEKVFSKSSKAGKFKHDKKVVHLFHEKRMICNEFIAKGE